MDLSSVDVFELAKERLSWTDRREQVLAQNVANANTPGYQPRDLKPFAAFLEHTVVPLAATNPLHLAGLSDPIEVRSGGSASERAPDGNAVSLDEQLMKLADTTNMHELASNLYSKYLSMFRLALGRTG